MSSPPTERRLAAQIAAHSSWANTADRTARTAAPRAALDKKFLDEAGGDPVRAEHLKRAHYARLSLKSVRSRRKAKELLAQAEAAETELTGGQIRPVPVDTPANHKRAKWLADTIANLGFIPTTKSTTVDCTT